MLRGLKDWETELFAWINSFSLYFSVLRQRSSFPLHLYRTFRTYKIRRHRNTACRMLASRFAASVRKERKSRIGVANRRDVSRWFKDDEGGTWHSSTNDRRQCRHGCINSMVHYRQCLWFFNYWLVDGGSSLRWRQGRPIKKILDRRVCSWVGEKRIYFIGLTLRTLYERSFEYEKSSTKIFRLWLPLTNESSKSAEASFAFPFDQNNRYRIIITDGLFSSPWKISRATVMSSEVFDREAYTR